MSDEIALMTRGNPWRVARAVNCTDSSFPSKVPTGTEPTGTGATASAASVIDLTDPVVGGLMQNGAEFLFFGEGSDTNTFSARIIGWSQIQTAGGTFVPPEQILWVPTVLVEVSVALSLQTGVANKVLNASQRFADTITLVGTTAVAGVDVNITSPANDTIARMYVDLWGFQKLEVTFDMTGATNGNALFRLL